MSWNTKNVTLFAIVGLILARPAHAQGQDGGGPDPTSPFITTASDADRALELRMAIGLGPMALAALDVNDSGYATLAHAGLTYYRQRPPLSKFVGVPLVEGEQEHLRGVLLADRNRDT